MNLSGLFALTLSLFVGFITFMVLQMGLAISSVRLTDPSVRTLGIAYNLYFLPFSNIWLDVFGRVAEALVDSSLVHPAFKSCFLKVIER